MSWLWNRDPLKLRIEDHVGCLVALTFRDGETVSGYVQCVDVIDDTPVVCLVPRPTGIPIQAPDRYHRRNIEHFDCIHLLPVAPAHAATWPPSRTPSRNRL